MATADDRYGVVRVIARLNVGGPALQAIDLTQRLDGPYRTLLVTGDVDFGEADLMSDAEARGIDLVRIPELGRRLSPWKDVVALAKLVQLLRRVRPSIVHTHTAKAGTLGRIASILAGVPARVHTFHGHVFSGYFGRAKTLFFLGIERLLARVTARVVTVSPGLVDDLVDKYRICRRERMRVVRLGFDLSRFASAGEPERRAFREELCARPGTGVVTIVGRLAPIKNHPLFLEVAARLTAEGRDCVFCVVGGGSEEAALRAYAAELGIEAHVRFLGWRFDLDRVYAGSDVVVLTSRNEGTPVCLIEALASARPVVSTDVGGVADVLDGGDLGVMVPSGDTAALAAAVGALLDDPAERSDLGRAGREHALRNYGIDRLVRDIRAVYDEIGPLHPRQPQTMETLRTCII